MELELSGDVAVVFGAARGIGLAIAAAFAAEKASVVLVDRDAAVEETAQRLAETSGAACWPLAADVADEPAIRVAAAEIEQRFGRCDHLVFAAAVGSGKFGMPFWNVAPSDWQRVLAVNLVGAVNVAHAFAPAMAARRRGTLLFIASVAGQVGSPTDPPYSASKAGLINFAQCAARDLAPHGVRVNTICPGMVRTALNESVYKAWAAQHAAGRLPTYDEWAAEKIARMVPLKRWQEPEEIAALAVFLASPRAKSITGQTMNVDGGYVMHW